MQIEPDPLDTPFRRVLSSGSHVDAVADRGGVVVTADEPAGDDAPTDPSVTYRYGRLSLGDGGVIVYDRDRVNAWVQSSVAYDLPMPASTTGTTTVDLGCDESIRGGDPPGGD